MTLDEWGANYGAAGCWLESGQTLESTVRLQLGRLEERVVTPLFTFPRAFPPALLAAGKPEILPPA